jgi:hypothetical protein
LPKIAEIVFAIEKETVPCFPIANFGSAGNFGNSKSDPCSSVVRFWFLIRDHPRRSAVKFLEFSPITRDVGGGARSRRSC